MAIILVRTIRLFVQVFFWLILVRAVLSWVRPARPSKFYYDIQTFVYRATEPVLAPIRNLLPRTGMIDWSPLVALILLEILERLLVGLIYSLL